MSGTQRRGPALAQVLEIGFARFDAIIHLSAVCISTNEHKIDGQSDREVGAHGGIHRNQADLEGVVEVGIEADGAV